MTPTTTTTPTTETPTPAAILDYNAALAAARAGHDAEVAEAIADGDADRLVALRSSVDTLPLTVAVEVLGNVRQALGGAEAELAEVEGAVGSATAERDRHRAHVADLEAKARDLSTKANPPGIAPRSGAERDAVAVARTELPKAQSVLAAVASNGPAIDRAVARAVDAARPHRKRVEDLRRQVVEAERRVAALVG